MAKTLFIPVDVEAMVINYNTKTNPRNGYRRATLDYTNLKNNDILISEASQKSKENIEGIYIKWNLIEALKNGKYDESKGDFSFPLIPNRWLVLRYCNSSKSISKSWIVQSDYLGKNATTSFVDPYLEDFSPTKIGKKYDLDNWQEEENSSESFLTAMGAGGDIMFSVFQPYNEDVLSIKDEWEEISKCKNISYFVAGWYSDKKDDVVSKEILTIIQNEEIKDEEISDYLKEELGLNLNKDDLNGLGHSIYFGSVCDIEIKEDEYKSDKPRRDNVSIVLGNNDTDALGATLANNKNSHILKLFTEHILSKLDIEGNSYAFSQELHKTWFEPDKSGELYVSKNGLGKRVEEINFLQKEINSLSKELKYQQKELFRFAFTKRKYNSTIKRLSHQQQRRLHLTYSEEDLEKQIENTKNTISTLFENISSLKDKLVIKEEEKENYERISLSNYYMSKDPTVMFIGLKSKKYDDSLINVIVEEEKDNSIFSKLPNGVDFIYNKFLEFNSTTIDNSKNENYSFIKWKQPWRPLFIEWTIHYYSIDFNEGWEFTAKGYKQLQNRDNNISSTTIKGKNIITSNNTFALSKLLNELKDKYSDLSADDLVAIDKLVEEVSNYDHLSQKLEGFHLGLRQETQEVGAPFGKDINYFINGMDHSRPDLGIITDDGIGKFRDFRSGFFTFSSLYVVDEFGQSLPIIPDIQESDKDYIISKDLLTKDNSARKVLLAPRFLQTCRLNFDLVFEDNEEIVVDESTLENPIFAWVLPNHLDKSLDFYDNEGKYLGKVSIFSKTANKQETLYKGEEIKDGHLKKFLNSPVIKDLDSYKNFFETIDKTLWNVDPLGDREDSSLSVLIGRALALVRTKLEYELKDEPIVYGGWKYALEANKPNFINYNLPILLGSNELRSDGLVGFFEGDDYTKFNCVHLPSIARTDKYIKQISPKNLLNLRVGELDKDNRIVPDKKYMTMLLDPRGKVNATSHILPVKKLSIPNKFIDSIKSIAINFRIDSLLTNIIKEEENPKITMPIPIQTTGEWDFRLSIDDVKNFELLSSNNDLANNNTDTTIKSGYLNLTIKDKNE